MFRNLKSKTFDALNESKNSYVCYLLMEIELGKRTGNGIVTAFVK